MITNIHTKLLVLKKKKKKTNMYRMFPIVPGSVLSTVYSVTQSLQPSCEVGTFIFLF